MQINPRLTRVGPACFQRLLLQNNGPLLNVAFNSNLRPYGMEPSLQMFLGIIIACCSINLYFMPNDIPAPPVAQAAPIVVNIKNTED